MLKVNQQQLDALGEKNNKRFAELMVIHLRHCYPEKTRNISDDELKEVVDYLRERAKTYQVVESGDVMRFIECGVRYGADFDLDVSWINDALNLPDADGARKMDLIDEMDEQLSHAKPVK